jgi:hypothetical protein
MKPLGKEDMKPEAYFREKIAAREAGVAAYIEELMNTDRQPDFDELEDQARKVKSALRAQDRDRENDVRKAQRRSTRRQAWNRKFTIDINRHRKLASMLQVTGFEEAGKEYAKGVKRLRRQRSATIRKVKDQYFEDDYAQYERVQALMEIKKTW